MYLDVIVITSLHATLYYSKFNERNTVNGENSFRWCLLLDVVFLDAYRVLFWKF